MFKAKQLALPIYRYVRLIYHYVTHSNKAVITSTKTTVTCFMVLWLLSNCHIAWFCQLC